MANLDGETGDPALAGVYGKNTGAGGVGVAGVSQSGDGVRAVSTSGNGISAFSDSSVAAYAKANGQPGVVGISESNDGVRAVSTSGNGLSAFSTSGTGLYAEGVSNAAYFKGNVLVTGDVQLTEGAGDLAEEFDMDARAVAEPGSVMVLTDAGGLCPATEPYDRRVAGIVTGAGRYRPGLVLDRHHDPDQPRGTIALVGKVYCKADADPAAIEVGDLLTTSSRPGHAQKAMSRDDAFGAVLGKAMEGLPSGQGLIPVLVALQ